MSGGLASRRKGCRGETAAKHLLTERDYECVHNRDAGCDFVALKGGKAWAVEVKHTASLMHSAYTQCRDDAKGARMLMWKPSRWGLPANLWIVFEWPEGSVHVWRAK